jgi:uncharacterized protein (TIGR00369 family)
MYLNAATNKYYMPTISIDRGSAEIVLQVRPDFFQSAGSVHGSVYFKLLDDSAYFAAHSVITDTHLFTASFNLYFIRPVTSGVMKAVGTLKHRSSRLIIAESVVYNLDDHIVAQGSGTFMKSTVPLDEKAGYC